MNYNQKQLSSFASIIIEGIEIHSRNSNNQIDSFFVHSNNSFGSYIFERVNDKYERGLFLDPILGLVVTETVNAIEELAKVPASFFDYANKCHIRKDIIEYMEEYIKNMEAPVSLCN